MNYNPYAAPNAALPPPAPAPSTEPPGSFDAGKVLAAAFGAFQENAGVLMGATFVFLLFRTPFGAAPLLLRLSHVADPRLSLPTRLAAYLVTVLVDAFFSVGLVRLSLAAARRERVALGDLFRGASHFPSMLLVVVLAICLELATCCTLGAVPMFLGLCFAPFYVVDQSVGPFEAFRLAWRDTEGRRGAVLLYSALSFLVFLAGVALCGVGMIVSIPISLLGFAILYVRITGRGPGPAA